jgi:hypothetical protein
VDSLVLRPSGAAQLPFPSLDGSFRALEEGDDAVLAYAQSRAMVELLVSLAGDHAVADAVERFCAGRDTRKVFAEAARREVGGRELLEFLSRR